MTATLLGPDDPPPVEIVNEASDYPVVLVCEHAGRVIPRSLGSLGLHAPHLDDHIALDIGAGHLSRLLAERLGTTTVLQRYSRLVIDCNRPLDAPDSVPEISDQVTVPGNRGLTDDQRRARIEAIFMPFDRTVGAVLDRGHGKAAFSIHSFTPVFGGVVRPWDVSFLSRRDSVTSKVLARNVGRRNGDLVIGFDQPYQIEDESDWFIPQHAETRDLPHSLIEVRNNHLRSDEDIAAWASILADAIGSFAETL
ncbi:MAG: N-formylglutamate amidohydrolase [Alphaproteobacteria bacterium]